jgi:exosome complex component RRP41
VRFGRFGAAWDYSGDILLFFATGTHQHNSLTPCLLSHVDGSALYEQGNTKIIASVYGPREAKRRTDSIHDRAAVTCEYSVTSFSTSERKQRSKSDRRLKERSLALKKIFEAVICTKLYPRSQISIFVQVLQSDGGDMPAAINAGTLALIDAGIPMQDVLTACSAGFLDGTPIMDLNYTEGNAHASELTLAVCPRSKTISYMQMDNKLPIEHLEKVTDMATEGCLKIAALLKDAVKKHSLSLLHARGAATI